jgi:hypothetical protein
VRRTHKIWLAWGAIWLATRALMVAQVGFWNDVAGTNLEDVHLFEIWVEFLNTEHLMPLEDSWQYPPGAAFLLLAIGAIPAAFGESFVGTMLVFDLAGLMLIAALAGRERRDTGVWVWLLAMPLLLRFPLLRFDLVPTVIAVGALAVVHRRPVLFGSLAGLGAAVKAWPIVLLAAEWNPRRLARAAAAALAVVALCFAVAGIAFGDQTGFLDGQSGRGLQLEAVAATPWHLRQTFTGEPPFILPRFGASEIASGPADAIASAMEALTLLVIGAAAVWWWLRLRAIRRGRTDLEDPAVSRDFVFTIVLLLVVCSKVGSPQFMVWMLGLAAVVLTAGTARLARPAWIVVAAIGLTGALAGPPGLVMRNTALLAAAADAALAMTRLVRRP